MILTSLEGVSVDDFHDHTGWQLKSDGLCQGDICVPAPGGLRPDGTIDVAVAAQVLGMPLEHSVEHDVWALGPATLNGKALATAQAADPELLTRDGSTFRLSSLRGRKVLLVAWASY
ncbi:hypothetical protein BH10ACT2_BH10ACT2_20400 [soil metagenome]